MIRRIETPARCVLPRTFVTCYPRPMTRRVLVMLSMSASLGAAACGGDDPAGTGGGGTGGTGGQQPGWTVVHEQLPGALLSVWGTGADDVWTVGGDARDGTGPLVLHYDGSAWERIETGETEGDLWWVFGFDGGPIYMGGAGGVILRYEGGSFTKMDTPGNGTVFGIWGASPSDVWAVGGQADKEGFAWKVNGDTWEPEPSLPAADVTDAAIWKVYGRSASDAVLVGSSGLSYTWDGTALSPADTGVGSSLFTVHASAERYVAVGGFGTGIVVEYDGSTWTDLSPTSGIVNGLTGVVLSGSEGGYAVGQFGAVYERSAGSWTEVDTELSVQDDLHGVWADSDGGVWAVGGKTASLPLVGGVLIYRGDDAPPSEL